MSKTTRSISLPARTVLGGGMKGEQGTRGVSSNVKGKGSQRGREKEKELEVRWTFYESRIHKNTVYLCSGKNIFLKNVFNVFTRNKGVSLQKRTD